MGNNEGGLSCTQGCWALAVLAGVIAAALLMLVGDWRLIPAIFALVVITVILGALLQWIMCKPLSKPGEVPARNRSENAVPTSKPSAPAAATQAPQGVEAPPDTPGATAPAAEKSVVKPSKTLAGEAELASRKGTWKYDGGATEAAPAPKPAAAPKAEAPAPAAEAPANLSAAREGGPDDLKMIKGVGPKLEQLLHRMGFFHFDQIAAWSEREVAWVDENLEGFKGRVSRDNWVEQARTFAEGGSAESSGKVKKGDVQ